VYTFKDHAEHLYAAWEALGLAENVTLVIHDWGSALGFNWARLNPEAIKGICYMEAVVAPVPSWDAWPERARQIFQALRSPAGEDMVLEKNVFVERILTASIMRELAEEEMNEYRRPFATPGEDRRPTLTWPRQIPIAGEPPEVVEVAAAYAKWMAENDIPKLFIDAQPGSILTGDVRDFCLTWKNQTVAAAKGLHFLQEDSPDEIGEALSNWLKTL
ncbi:MAG: haloalkane dehalogenase, partial [Pseudomonadota bacterium]